MPTKKSQTPQFEELVFDLSAQVRAFKARFHTIETNLQRIEGQLQRESALWAKERPIEVKRGDPKGAPIEIDMQTRRELAAQAQFLGLRNVDELIQIVLHAFLEMCEVEGQVITFPLALSQLETVQ